MKVRTSFRSCFSPVPVRLLGIKLRSSGLVPSTFAYCAISPAHICQSMLEFTVSLLEIRKDSFRVFRLVDTLFTLTLVT